MGARTFLPSKEDARKFVIVIGLVAWVMAIVEVVVPRVSAPTGRWSWITGTVFNAFGPYGMAVLWAVVGAALLGAAFRRG